VNEAVDSLQDLLNSKNPAILLGFALLPASRIPAARFTQPGSKTDRQRNSRLQRFKLEIWQ